MKNQVEFNQGQMAMRLLLVVGMIFLVISCGKRQGQVGVLPEAGGEQVVPFEVWFPDGRGHHKGSKRPLVLLSHGSGGNMLIIAGLSAPLAPMVLSSRR